MLKQPDKQELPKPFEDISQLEHTIAHQCAVQDIHSVNGCNGFSLFNRLAGFDLAFDASITIGVAPF
jgi:hypothetical protein